MSVMLLLHIDTVIRSLEVKVNGTEETQIGPNTDNGYD